MARGLGVKNDQRRNELTEAGLRLVEAHGTEALTFRRVTQEAGVSLGRTQHYFGTREKLIKACFERAQERVQQRVQERLTAIGEDPSPYDVISASLEALLPRKPAELAELRVAELFHGLALTDPALREVLRAGQEDFTAFLAQQISAARASEQTRAGLDPTGAAQTLLALATGLSGGILDGWLSADQAVALLRDQLRARCATDDHDL